MPHLVLKHEWSGSSMALTMIDTAKGEVIEIKAHGDLLTRRKPTNAELLEAGKILGGTKDVPGTLTRAQFAREQERTQAMQERIAALKVADRHNTERIAELEKDVIALVERQMDSDAMAVVTTALEIRIEELAMAGDLSGYARAKEVYEQMTGRSWVDEDE